MRFLPKAMQLTINSEFLPKGQYNSPQIPRYCEEKENEINFIFPKTLQYSAKNPIITLI